MYEKVLFRIYQSVYYVGTSTDTRDALLLDYIFNPPLGHPTTPFLFILPTYLPTYPPSLPSALPPTILQRRYNRPTDCHPRGISSTFVFRMELLCRRFHLLYMRARALLQTSTFSLRLIELPGELCILNRRHLSIRLIDISSLS